MNGIDAVLADARADLTKPEREFLYALIAGAPVDDPVALDSLTGKALVRPVWTRWRLEYEPTQLGFAVGGRRVVDAATIGADSDE